MSAQNTWDAVQEDWRRKLRGPRSSIPPALQALGSDPKKTARPKRVLIVEDDLDSARSLFMLVQEMGHAAEYAINGYVAIGRAQLFRPDVVLLDLGLPDLNGFDVCSLIKRDPQLKHVRVIVITGYAQDEYRSRSKAAGCELHLIKPVAPAVIEHLLDG